MAIGAKTDKEAAARALAEAHFKIDASIERIFRVVHPDAERERNGDEPIKLLEVNADTVASGILPIYFGPDHACGLLFPSIIIEIRPEEFDDLEQGDLALPHGWQKATEYPRPPGD